MKKISVSLVLLFFCASLYPLTNEDWRVIYALRTGSYLTGILGGGFFGYKLGTAIGHYLVSNSILSDAGGLTSEDMADIAKIRQYRWWQRNDPYLILDAPSFILTPTGIITGSKFGYLGGEYLATAYIARKYGISRAEASNAINNNLDLSERLRK